MVVDLGPRLLPERVRVGATAVTPLRLEALLTWLAERLASHQQCAVLYVNAHAVVLAEMDADFRRALAAAEVVFCDGVGVWLAARWLGAPLPERFTPPDWVDRLGRLCAAHGRSVFMLGGTHDAVSRAAAALRKCVPGLEVHAHHGYFDKSGPENERMIAAINAAQPGALLVGFGMPAQELWITAHRARLKATLILAVGGMFDYLGGSKTRGPRWLTDHGFEWLWRLATEPRRLWRRYVLGLPRFAWIVLRQKKRAGAKN